MGGTVWQRLMWEAQSGKCLCGRHILTETCVCEAQSDKGLRGAQSDKGLCGEAQSGKGLCGTHSLTKACVGGTV